MLLALLLSAGVGYLTTFLVHVGRLRSQNIQGVWIRVSYGVLL